MKWFVSLLFPLSAMAAGSGAYEAVVVGEQGVVRSGPGSKFYETMSLPPGTRVRVIMQERGGWLRIAPPAGSISWVPSRFLERNGNSGVVRVERAGVRIGNVDGDEHSIEHRVLTRGDRVKILEERVLSGDSRPEQWCQIAPPRGEFRWIAGKEVEALDQDQRSIKGANERAIVKGNKERASVKGNEEQELEGKSEQFVVSQQVKKSGSSSGEDLQGSRSKEKAVSGPVWSHEIQSTSANSGEWKYLRELDASLARHLEQDLMEWDLAPFEARYRELAENAQSERIYQSAVGRLRLIAQKYQLHASYAEFVQVRTASATRDRELQQQTVRRAVPTRMVTTPPQSVLVQQPSSQGPVLSEIPPDQTQRKRPRRRDRRLE